MIYNVYDLKRRLKIISSAISPSDVAVVSDYCRRRLDLESAGELQSDHYQCVPVCVIDAVFSIGVRYESTEAVVRRFCRYFNLPYSGPERLPNPEDQLSIADFLGIYDQFGVDRMTDEVYRNRQRTSTRSGILKSEAVLRFSRVLHRHGISYLQDVDPIISVADFEADIQQIPGQRSGTSLRAFYMLMGADEYIKPDRMIHRFLYSALGRNLTNEDCHHVLIGAQELLEKDYPALTPKSLDNLIWRYQRGQ